jgi:hypothetical protein
MEVSRRIHAAFKIGKAAVTFGMIAAAWAVPTSAQYSRGYGSHPEQARIMEERRRYHYAKRAHQQAIMDERRRYHYAKRARQQAIMDARRGYSYVEGRLGRRAKRC